MFAFSLLIPGHLPRHGYVQLHHESRRFLGADSSGKTEGEWLTATILSKSGMRSTTMGKPMAVTVSYDVDNEDFSESLLATMSSDGVLLKLNISDGVRVHFRPGSRLSSTGERSLAPVSHGIVFHRAGVRKLDSTSSIRDAFVLIKTKGFHWLDPLEIQQGIITRKTRNVRPSFNEAAPLTTSFLRSFLLTSSVDMTVGTALALGKCQTELQRLRRVENVALGQSGGGTDALAECSSSLAMFSIFLEPGEESLNILEVSEKG